MRVCKSRFFTYYCLTPVRYCKNQIIKDTIDYLINDIPNY